MYLRVHGTIANSSANGPGERFCIWLQGCSMEPKCPGCFNQDSWDPSAGTEISVSDLIKQIGNSSVTISGGEPLDQLEPLIELCSKIKKDIIVFTGKEFVPEELKKVIDIAIVGPYKHQLRTNDPLLGSSNQSLVRCGDRISITDLYDCDCEIIISPDGEMKVSGIAPMDIKEDK